MPIEVYQADGEGKNGRAAVVRPYKGIPNGPITYTHPFANDISAGQPFINPVYGVDMAQNGQFGGTPDGVHNGTDSALWTGTNLAGTNFVFDSTTQKKSGTKSVDGVGTNNNNEALFTRSSVINGANYIALTGWIYIIDWSTAGTEKEVQIRNRIGGVDIGDALNLSDFINKGLFNTWQKFTVNIDLFNIGPADFDELVVKTVDIGGGSAPSYFLDDIQWENDATGSLSYGLFVPKGFEFFLEEITFAAAGPLDSRLADGTHANIPYDKFVGETMDIGVLLQVQSNAGIFNAAIFGNHIEFMSTPNMEFQSGGDGTNTWVVYRTRYSTAPSLKGDANGVFQIVINDDLSNLLYFRSIARGKLRALPDPNGQI